MGRGREPESLKELLCVREWERSAEDRSGFLETVLEESSRWSSRPNTSSREEVAGRGLLSVCLKVDGCPRYHFEATVVENCCMHVLQTRSRRISAHVQLCAQRIHVSSEWFPEKGVPTLASYREDAHRAAISCHLYTRDIHGFSSSSISDKVIKL